MNVRDMQRQATEGTELYDSKMEGCHDVDTTVAHLIEEIGEVARHIYNAKIGRDRMDKKALSYEIADASILLAHLATLYGIDLEEAVQEKMAELRRRYGD